mgnify:CR=1
MKAKFATVLCLLLSLSALCGVSVYAAGNEIETVVTYTKQESTDQGGGSSADEPSRPVYEIAIPMEKDIAKKGTLLPIQLTENNIPAGYKLNVYIDSKKTFDKLGYFHLTGTKDGADALAYIFRYVPEGYAETFWTDDLAKVAAFDCESNLPVEFGTLTFEILNEDDIVPDTYTGRMYFKLELVEE